MTSNEKAELKLLINSKIEILIKKIAVLKELTKPIEPDCAIGRVSRMDAINNKSINEAALLKKTEELNGLEYAIAIIDTPDFGICSNCNKTIPNGRLLIIPKSRLCVVCARLKN